MPISDIPRAPISDELQSILWEFTPKRRRTRISLDARLLHDLLITGDEMLSLWHRFDPLQIINMDGFNIDEFIPSELSWDALLIVCLGRFDREEFLTRKYKEFYVSDLLRLKQGEKWKDVFARA